jgi:ferritin-like metal-binding protein YciE
MNNKINKKIDKAINKLNKLIEKESFKNGIVYHFRMTDRYIKRIQWLCRLRDNVL